MELIDDKLKAFPHQQRSLLPTPVHKLPSLSATYGPTVLCKRDDLTGFGFGGNKTRKLEYLIADALSQGCDTLLAAGSSQSNFCRIVAAYGSVNDLEVHLILGGDEPPMATGNLRLDHMLGANCKHVLASDWEIWEAEARKLQESLSRQRRKVYRMPIGGSTPIGALGYVSAFSEIMDDEQRLGIRFDSIVVASASAGTHAGLVVGKAVSGWEGRIIGISVAKGSGQQESDVMYLAEQTGELLGAVVNPDTVIVEDGYLGEGYAFRTTASEEAITYFARECGIFLDHVYTGKAAAGLMDYLRTGHFPLEGNILFLHTGGTPELFE